VKGPKPPPYLLSAEVPAGAEQRGSFANAASEFGMRVRLPGDAELSAWGIAADHLPALPPSGEASGEAIVTGTLEWSESLPGWVGKWRTCWKGVDHAWGIGGVNYDAAFRDIVQGIVLLASGRGAPD
jgi:hypothetical protein